MGKEKSILFFILAAFLWCFLCFQSFYKSKILQFGNWNKVSKAQVQIFCQVENQFDSPTQIQDNYVCPSLCPSKNTETGKGAMTASSMCLVLLIQTGEASSITFPESPDPTIAYTVWCRDEKTLLLSSECYKDFFQILL